MSFIRELSLDTTKYLIFRIFTILTGFITIPIIARIFKPEEFGIYSIITTSVTIFTFVSSEWIKSSFLRYFHEYENKNDVVTLISTSFFILFFVDFISVMLALIVNIFIKKLFILDFILLILLIFFSTYQSIAINYYRIKQQIIKLNIFQLFPKLTFFIVFLPLVYYDIFYNNIRAIIVSGLIANFLFLTYTLRKLYLEKYISLQNINIKLISDFSKYGIPIAFMALISTIFSSSDRYIILYLVDEKATGIYSFAYNLANKSFLIIPQTITMAMWPIILKYSEKNFKYTLNKIYILQRFYFILIFPLTLVIDYFSREIFKILSATEYYDGALFFNYIIYGIFIGSLVWYFNTIFMIKKNTKIMMWAYFVATILNVVFNFFLIPYYGYHIAATTTLFSYIIYFGIMAVMVIKEEKDFIKNIVFMLSVGLLIFIIFKLNLKIMNFFEINIINDVILKFVIIIPVIFLYIISIIYFYYKNKKIITD